MITLPLYILVMAHKHSTEYLIFGSREEAYEALYEYVSECWKERCNGEMPEDKENAIDEFYEQNFWDEGYEIEYCPFGITEREQKFICLKIREAGYSCLKSGSEALDEEEIR